MVSDPGVYVSCATTPFRPPPRRGTPPRTPPLTRVTRAVQATVCWNTDGDGFVIHSIKRFEREVLTKFFTTT